MGGDNRIHRFIWLPRRWKPIPSSASRNERENLHSLASFANNSEITQRSDERCSKKKVPWLSAIAPAQLRLMFSNLHNCRVCFSAVRGAHFRCCVVFAQTRLAWTWSRDLRESASSASTRLFIMAAVGMGNLRSRVWRNTAFSVPGTHVSTKPATGTRSGASWAPLVGRLEDLSLPCRREERREMQN